MYVLTHANEHIFGRYDECPLCATRARARGDQRKVIPCRYLRVLCDHKGAGCDIEAIVDCGPRQSFYTLPPDWAVLEMEAMVDFQRFICRPCQLENEAISR